jgi:anaerobic selenocysteine-containing dehydrogenase
LTLVDPVHHGTAGRVDQVVAPRPGRDLELALGVGRALFDRGAVHPLAPERCNGLDGFRDLVHQHTVAGWAGQAGVECAYIQGLAEALAEGPTAILVGWGMQRRLRGGAIVRALDALSALSGNLYVRGGGCSFYFRRRKPFAELAPPVRHPRVVREPLMARDLVELRDPPIRMMWVTAGNPVVMVPDSAGVARALEQLEFLVVADPFLSDTARRAHLVLPVPTLLEDDDVLGSYGHHWVGESRPVVPAPAGMPHEIEIFQRLADQLGLDGYPRGSIDDLKRMALEPSARKGLSLERLREQGAVRSPLSDNLLFADGKVATPSGRVELLEDAPPPPELPVPPEAAGASAPLWLFSNSTARSQASVWSGVGLGERVWVAVHPDAVPGVAHGATVRVESVHGMLTAELRHDAALRTDVVVMPKGGSFDRGQSANALVPACATDLGLGAAYLDVLVRIRPVAVEAANGAAR